MISGILFPGQQFKGKHHSDSDQSPEDSSADVKRAGWLSVKDIRGLTSGFISPRPNLDEGS